MAPPVHEEKKPPAPAPKDKKTPASVGPTVTDEPSKWDPEYAVWEGDNYLSLVSGGPDPTAVS